MNKLTKSLLIVAITIGVPLLVFQIWFAYSVTELFHKF